MALPETAPSEPLLDLPIRSASGNGVLLSRCQALSAVLRNGAIDNGATVNAFPGIKDEEKIREPLQHHEPFALWTFHHSLLGKVFTAVTMSSKRQTNFNDHYVSMVYKKTAKKKRQRWPG
jgi:hypothetical protein